MEVYQLSFIGKLRDKYVHYGDTYNQGEIIHIYSDNYKRKLFYPKLVGIKAYLFRVLNQELHGLDPYKYRVCRHLAKGLGSFSRVLHSKETHA